LSRMRYLRHDIAEKHRAGDEHEGAQNLSCPRMWYVGGDWHYVDGDDGDATVMVRKLSPSASICLSL
jgi:hypothetical protein